MRKTKKHTNAKAKVYDGIQFKSLLEITMYKKLKEAGVSFGYETKKFTIVTSEAIEFDVFERPQRRSKTMKNRKGLKTTEFTYTPDFVPKKGLDWIIETKGRKLGNFTIKWNIFQKMFNRKRNKPILFLPKNTKDCQQVIDILIEKGYGRKQS